MEMKKMSKKTTEKTEEPKIRSKVSSAFTRHVGTVRIDVVNTKQNSVSKKADKQKWAVIVTNGKKVKLHSGHAKKSDAIASLRAHEIVLKAADKSE
jgi:hypothetical protein